MLYKNSISTLTYDRLIILMSQALYVTTQGNITN